MNGCNEAGTRVAATTQASWEPQALQTRAPWRNCYPRRAEAGDLKDQAWAEGNPQRSTPQMDEDLMGKPTRHHPTIERRGEKKAKQRHHHETE